jgi:carboxymethylenebutenolidase
MDDFESDRRSLLPQRDIDRRQVLTVSLAAGFAAAVRPLPAQSAIVTNSEGLTEGDVRIPVPDGDIPGYRAMPEKGGPFAIVLIVHEIFGVHEHIRDICRRFGKLGYMAIAPDLFARQGDVSQMTDIKEIISKVVSKVADAQVMADLDATAKYAADSGSGDASRLGITGFCWGGRITWLYAAHSFGLRAAVAWYGRLTGERTPLTPRHPHDLEHDLKAPVLGLYGGSDPGIPIGTIDQMRAACMDPRNGCEIIVYPDAGHAFNADYRPSFRPFDAFNAWKRMLVWFRDNGVV